MENQPIKTSDDAIIASKLLPLVGGANNIVTATNCMTRLRLLVKDDKIVKIDEIKKVMGVLGVLNDGTLIQIVLGPGKVRKVTDEFNELISLTQNAVPMAVMDEEARKKKEEQIKRLSTNPILRFFQRIGFAFKNIKWKKGFRHIGNCFSPLIPGFIFFGICYSISVIINVAVTPHEYLQAHGLIDIIGMWGKWPVTQVSTAAIVFFLLFRCIAIGFINYLAIFVGINAAKEFGVTPVIGGAIGGLSMIPEIVKIAEKLGMQFDLGKLGGMSYVITAGNGGVIAVIFAVFLIGFLERFIKKHMPNVLDTVFTPLLTILIGGSVFLFAIMPLIGVVSSAITYGIGFVSSGALHWAARAAIGFVLGAIFMPIISLGLHHGLTGFYTELMGQPGGLVLYPIFAMNDACHVGVAASIYKKARKVGHKRLQNNIQGGIVPQILGISEPLIYGVTMPMAKPYLPIALGAGVAGAWINAWGVGFCSFDCSGLMGIPLCMWVNIGGTPTINPLLSMGLYVCGWLIAVISGFIFASLLIKNEDLERIDR